MSIACAMRFFRLAPLTLLIATSRTITAASTPATVYSTTGFTRWAMISPMVGTGVAVGSGLGVGGTAVGAGVAVGSGVGAT